MALFRRKKETTVLPDIDQYYDGETRERTGLAWLLALISVAIVALVLVGVFLAGRWAYREVTKNSDDDTVAVVGDGSGSDDAVNLPSFDGEGEKTGETSSTNTDSDKTGSNASDQSGSTGSVAGESTDEEAAASIPSTGDNSPLPSTGPASTLAVFAGVSVLAGAAHYATQKRTNT